MDNILKQLCLAENINELFNLAQEREYAKRLIYLQKYGMTPQEIFDSRDVVVFGAGGLGKKIVMQLLRQGKKPLYICDNNYGKWGSSLLGIEIKSPKSLSADKDNIITLVALDWSGDVCEQLDKMGVEYLFYDKNGEIGCCAQPALHNEKENLISSSELFFDSFSKKVLLNILKARLFPELFFKNLGNPFIQDITSGSQFLDRKYFKYGDNEVFIDCGAYHADALVGFFKLIYENGLKDPKVYVFEADDAYYNKTEAIVKQYGFDNVTLIKAAVGDKDTSISLLESGYSLEASANELAGMCRLDSKLEDVPVTFIKMDIEGFEHSALNGAVEIIRKNKPKLAISAYHYSNDLYRIPILINSINPGYKVFLRHHLHQSFSETVCYAFVQQKGDKYESKDKTAGYDG